MERRVILEVLIVGNVRVVQVEGQKNTKVPRYFWRNT